MPEQCCDGLDVVVLECLRDVDAELIADHMGRHQGSGGEQLA